MSYVIISSTCDVASTNIANAIIEEFNFEETTQQYDGASVYRCRVETKDIFIITIVNDLAHAQLFLPFLNSKLLIFVSRHQSQSGRPTLSVHAPGNLGSAPAGGTAKKISIAPANAMLRALTELSRQRNRLRLDQFNVSYEATHHGPSLDVPCMFIEVGSTLKEWTNIDAATAVAYATIAAISQSDVWPVAVGIGGPHYNMNFTKLGLRGVVGFGHMIPKHMISQVTSKMISYCLKRTLEQPEYVILDWKGITGMDKKVVKQALGELAINVKRVKDFK